MLKEDLLKLIETRQYITTIDAFGRVTGDKGYVMHVWDDRVQLYMLDGEDARRLIELPYKKVQLLATTE